MSQSVTELKMGLVVILAQVGIQIAALDSRPVISTSVFRVALNLA
jgi:hypothetical protein